MPHDTHQYSDATDLVFIFFFCIGDKPLTLCQDPVPAPSLLHERLRAADVARFAAVPRVDGAGAHAADVRREEHDVRRGPAFAVGH